MANNDTPNKKTPAKKAAAKKAPAKKAPAKKAASAGPAKRGRPRKDASASARETAPEPVVATDERKQPEAPVRRRGFFAWLRRD